MITRFAPTPSGYLHLGNAVHLRVLAILADEADGHIALRIDDIDHERTRPEYVADIFDIIEWLDVPIAGEPRWQSRHLDEYRAAVDNLMSAGAYVCACSRTQWAAHNGPGCPQQCEGLDLVPGETAVRIPIGGESQDDIVIWRREGIPAYHLANVIDDQAMGITHIVRGADLRESSALQIALAQRLPGSTFANIEIVHHELITDAGGRKLSKSAGAQATPLARTEEVREEIETAAVEMRNRLTTVPS